MPNQAHAGASPPADAQSQIAMARIIGSAEAAKFCNLSLAHWLRLTREGKTPAPVRLGSRKLGWRLGQLVAYTNSTTGRRRCKQAPKASVSNRLD